MAITSNLCLNNMNLKKYIKTLIPEYFFRKRNCYLLDKQRVQFHRGCRELLELIDDILNKAEIEYFLTYGTLLGAYRDHDFIPHDYDLDIALFWEDHDKVKDLMLSKGLELKHEVHFGNWNNPENIEYRFEYKNTFIDIDFYKVFGNTAITCNPSFIPGSNYIVGQKFLVITEDIINPFNGLKEIEFLGRKYKVPANTEEFIIANYGLDYRTPIKDFNYKEHASNVHEYSLDDKKSFMIIYK